VKLQKTDPGYIDPDVTGKDALAETAKLCKRLRKLQASLHSEKQRSLLIVLQALDTGGKDGVINHVLGAMNPLSCRVASFKKPGPEAAAHNYLWRVNHIPGVGSRFRMVSVLNRLPTPSAFPGPA
jgi:polyphosphate kinase 2 (PPK2 family)